MKNGDLTTSPARHAALIVPAATDLGTVRALLATQDTTITLVDADGATVTNYPIQKGYNPIAARQVTAVTAGSVWALY